MADSRSSWPNGMDAEARIRHVALTRTTARNAGWIAEEADVSRDTAVKYLTRMVDRGELVAVETTDGVCYRSDGVTQFLREIRHLTEEHTADDLTEELRAVADEIDTRKSTYGVESPTELRRSVGDEELTAGERRARIDAAEEWEYDIEMREAIQLALALKQSLTALDAEGGVDLAGSGTLPQEG